jgi:hypothetical protein
MQITLMTTADFGNKQVVLNQSNSMLFEVITVLQHMYLGHKGNAKILLNFFKSENNVGAALHTVRTIQLW